MTSTRGAPGLPTHATKNAASARSQCSGGLAAMCPTHQAQCNAPHAPHTAACHSGPLWPTRPQGPAQGAQGQHRLCGGRAPHQRGPHARALLAHRHRQRPRAAVQPGLGVAHPPHHGREVGAPSWPCGLALAAVGAQCAHSNPFLSPHASRWGHGDRMTRRSGRPPPRTKSSERQSMAACSPKPHAPDAVQDQPWPPLGCIPPGPPPICASRGPRARRSPSAPQPTLAGRCFYRPRAPFADWMTLAADGGAEPVTPTPQELAILDKVGRAARAWRGWIWGGRGGGAAAVL